jgi:hypothetical protein
MKNRPLELKPREKTDPLQQQLEQKTQNALREMDREITGKLCERYRHVVPPERIARFKDMRTRFEDRSVFDRNYEKAVGKDPSRVLGFVEAPDAPAQVALDGPHVPKTVMHERLHQLSDPRAESLLGKDLYEGTTEDLAIKEAELTRGANAELPQCYTRQRAAAHEVRRLCGDRPVEQAYFRGDVTELRACLDRNLGHDNLERLRKLPALDHETEKKD